MSECIRCIQVETEGKVLSCRQRQAVAVTLAGIIHCIDVGKRLSICHLCINRTVIPVHVRGLRQGLTRLLISQVLVINIIQTLAEDTLSSPVDTQEIEIKTKVNTHGLSKLEVLIKYIDFLTTRSLQIICIQSLLVRIHDELHSRIIFCRVRRCLHTSIRKVVAQPDERNTTSEYTDTSTKDIFAVLLNVPTETYTRAPHRRTGKFLIGLETISLSCCPLIEFSILGWSIKEQRHIHTETIGKLETVSYIPLVLYIEAQLSCTKLRCPSRITGHLNISLLEVEVLDILTITSQAISSTTIVIIQEIVWSIKIIASIEILDEEIRELIKLVMCTECQRMITLEPCKVIFERIDILIQSISHRRIFITDIHGTISYLVNSDRWSWLTRSTRITNSYIRYTCLIAQVWRDAAL